MKKLFLFFGLFAAVGSAAAQVVRRLTLPPSVTLTWDAPTDPTITTVNIYYGIESGAYTMMQSAPIISATSTLTNLEFGTIYFIAATFVNSAGLESDYSVEISWKSVAVPQQPVLHIQSSVSGIQVSATGATPKATYVLESAQDSTSWAELEELIAGDDGEFAYLDSRRLPHTFYRTAAISF